MVLGTFVQKGVGIILILTVAYTLLRLFVFRPKNTTSTYSTYKRYTGEDFEKTKETSSNIVISRLKKELDPHKYSILQNVILSDGNTSRKFDYIVVGDSGAFLIDESVLGEDGKENGIDQTEVFIQEGDVWRIKCKDKEKTLQSPTSKMISNKEFMQEITGDLFMDIHNLLVLPNDHLTVHQEENLPFEVLGTQNLCKHISEYPDKINMNDKMEFLSRINSLKMS